MFNILKEFTDKDFKDFKVSKNKATNKDLPKMWSWLEELNGLPKMVAEGLKEYGTLEGRGSLNNKKIVNWADEVAQCNPNNYSKWAADWYNKDSIAWCGLFQALITCRSANGQSNRMPPTCYLSALAWASFGNPVSWQSNLTNIYLGDIAVFVRNGGGHVGTVIGISSDKKYLVLLAGNQSDAVNIKMVSISRLYAVRRVPYINKPAGARHFIINSHGVPISKNEA